MFCLSAKNKTVADIYSPFRTNGGGTYFHFFLGGGGGAKTKKGTIMSKGHYNGAHADNITNLLVKHHCSLLYTYIRFIFTRMLSVFLIARGN